MTITSPPIRCQILIVGGGPAGSYAASALSREGFDVALLEAHKFPRYHVGESMLPSLRSFLKFIDCEDKVANYGFCRKPGAAVKLNQWKREGYTDFLTRDGSAGGSWNVVRSEFDKLLLDHAAECGAKVFEQTRVSSLTFEPVTPPSSPILTGADDSSADVIEDPTNVHPRPIAAHWTNNATQTSGTITFDYLVDASGRNGIMSNKYLHNRTMNEKLKNVACWGYWKGYEMYMPGTERENAPFFEAMTDESGWGWMIPLHDGTVSVGIVMDQTISIAKKKARGGSSLTDHYHEQFEYLPHIRDLLKNATLVVEDGHKPNIKSATDYSYSASSYAGDHFRIVGDAAAFIDPFFSSGVHLAFSSALSAAATISASIRKDVTEAKAARYHDTKVRTSYTRFLLVVTTAYKQIRSQATPLLSDKEEDNFDRAFHVLQPVIQGTADVRPKLAKEEVRRTIEYCEDVVFSPDRCYPMSEADLRYNYADPYGMAKDEIEGVDSITYPNCNDGGLAMDDLEGLSVRLERGSLGLLKV